MHMKYLFAVLMFFLPLSVVKVIAKMLCYKHLQISNGGGYWLLFDYC